LFNFPATAGFNSLEEVQNLAANLGSTATVASFGRQSSVQMASSSTARLASLKEASAKVAKKNANKN